MSKIGEAPKTEQMRALKQALPELDKVADEVLKANSTISSEGIQNYYLKTKPKHSPDEGRIEIKPKPEMEVVKPPVAGEVLKQPQAGEVLKQPQPGEVLSSLKAGQMLKQPQKGEVIKPK